MIETAILCVGNRYRDGDAFGPLLYERLRDELADRGGRFDSVALHDIGTGSLRALSLCEGARRLIFIDAIYCKTDEVDSAPNTTAFGDLSWRGFGHEELLELPSKLQPGSGLHDAGLAELLAHLPLIFDQAELPRVELLLCSIRHSGNASAIAIVSEIQPYPEAWLSAAVERGVLMVIERILGSSSITPIG